MKKNFLLEAAIKDGVRSIVSDGEVNISIITAMIIEELKITYPDHGYTKNIIVKLALEGMSEAMKN